MQRSILVGALLLAAASPLAAQQTSRNDDYLGRVDTTVAFDRRGTVSLTIYGGEIIVRTWNRDQIQVRARSERSPIRVDATALRLSLDLTRPRGGDTHYEVTVPVAARVVARTTSGDISVTGVKGGVDLRTNSGDITLDDVGDMVDITTLSGDVTARGIAGRVEINTTSGDLSFSNVNGEVDAASVSGDIDLRDVVAKYVRARSTSGDVTFDGAVDTTGRYELSSHSGSVYLTVPQTTGALLTVSTYSGTIDSPDFPITLKPGEHGLGVAKRFTFEIGKGDARITAESFSGDITIRSRARRSQDR